MGNAAEVLYLSETPTATPVFRRRHCYESILIGRVDADHVRWIRSLQQRLRRHRGGTLSARSPLPTWPRRHRLGEIQQYSSGDETYTTVQALALLMHNRVEPVGFCSFAVGGGAQLAGRGDMQVVIDAVWIVEHEREQWHSHWLSAAVADVALRLAALMHRNGRMAEVTFELWMPLLTQSGHRFLVGCERALEHQHLPESEPFSVRTVIGHTEGELEPIDCLPLSENLLSIV